MSAQRLEAVFGHTYKAHLHKGQITERVAAAVLNILARQIEIKENVVSQPTADK